MAKRATGVGKHGKITNHKTKKRLEVKRQMLLAKAAKHLRHTRPINKERLKPTSS
jgi:hypothetical protein